MKVDFALNVPIEFERSSKTYKWYKREYKNILTYKSWNNIIYTSAHTADCYLVQTLIDKSGNEFYWLIEQKLITSQGVGRLKCKVNRIPIYPVELVDHNGGKRIKKLRTTKL